jgi:hypothetical protein
MRRDDADVRFDEAQRVGVTANDRGSPRRSSQVGPYASTWFDGNREHARFGKMLENDDRGERLDGAMVDGQASTGSRVQWGDLVAVEGDERARARVKVAQVEP